MLRVQPLTSHSILTPQRQKQSENYGEKTRQVSSRPPKEGGREEIKLSDRPKEGALLSYFPSQRTAPSLLYLLVIPSGQIKADVGTSSCRCLRYSWQGFLMAGRTVLDAAREKEAFSRISKTLHPHTTAAAAYFLFLTLGVAQSHVKHGLVLRSPGVDSPLSTSDHTFIKLVSLLFCCQVILFYNSFAIFTCLIIKWSLI